MAPPSTGRLLTHWEAAISAMATSSSPPPPSTIENAMTRSTSVARTTRRRDPAISGGSYFQIARKVSRR